MITDKELEKKGIKNPEELDAISITLIAKHVAKSIVNAFPFFNVDYSQLFMKVARLKMYKAEMELNTSGASYVYKNEAIYFKNTLSIETMKKLAIHEFIHHYQQVLDEKGEVKRFGLCDFTQLFTYGKGMNEASVQLISAKANKEKEEEVRYFDISFSTISPDYYPIECNLVRQMDYLVGKEVLFESTMNANDNFKNAMIECTSKKTFYTIQDNLDAIIKVEDKMARISTKIETENVDEKYIVKASRVIGKCKEKIRILFLQSQNLLITSYFDKAFSKIYSNTEISDFRKKLYYYRDYIGVTDKYSFFNQYYINMMERIDKKFGDEPDTKALIVYKKSIFAIFMEKMKKIWKSAIRPSSSAYENYDDKE